jgi:quinohemoprotein ethanol dehydrogenase
VRRVIRFLAMGAVVSIGLAAVIGASGSGSKSEATAIPNFSISQSAAPSGNDWISENGNVKSWRYSTLGQITSSNGGSLKQVWQTSFPTPTTADLKASANANPIAYNGILYQQDPWFRIFAVDGASGRILWSFDPQIGLNTEITAGENRTISIGNGMVYTAAAGTVYALNATTGAQVWATQLFDPTGGAAIDAAPVFYNGMLLLGSSGGDWAGRAQAFGLDAATGKVKWYYNVIPGNPKAEGWNTWPKSRAWYGGGAIWDPVTVDPTTGLVYIPTGNPIPYVYNGPGMELNTESVLALHADTGKFAWVFQEVHHDMWDDDAMQTPVNATVTINGKPVDVIDHANKDAYNYILNAATGKPVLGAPETPVPQIPAMNTYPTQPIPVGDELVPHVPPDPSAFNGLTAPDGKPYKIATSPFTPYDASQYVVVAPTYTGGIEWPENSYSQKTGLLYACVNVSEFAFEAFPQADIHLTSGSLAVSGAKTSSSPSFVTTGRLVAVNMSTNKIAWKFDTPGNSCSSPVTTTSSGLVLIGRANGSIQAFDDTTGSLLWTMPGTVASVPRFTVFAAGGKEYIAAFTNTALGGPQITTYSL